VRSSTRLAADAPVAEAVDAWLGADRLDRLDRGGPEPGARSTRPAATTIAAYRRDVEGIVGRITGGDDVARLRLPDLTKGALRAAFASWATDHAATSVVRAHSAWSSFFDFLVAEDLVDGNPMAAIAKPKTASTGPRPIRDPDAAARLLAAAVVVDPAARHPWPERDLAMIATFCVTGIRVGEAVRLNLGSLDRPVGGCQLIVVGNGGRTRTVPIHDALEAALNAYLRSRGERFPGADLNLSTAALFVDTRGRRLSADQVTYVIERLYVRAGLRTEVPTGSLVDALRHTFAISALQAGADIVQLQLLLGHASLETTRRYVQTSAVGLREMTLGHPAQVALRTQLQGTQLPGVKLPAHLDAHLDAQADGSEGRPGPLVERN
jgi:integrase/recombinase XerD